MEHPTRLTIAQAARELGMSDRTLRRRVAEGKIEAVKGTTPETGCAWFIEEATIQALLACPSNATELKAAAARKEEAVELAWLRDDVQQIKGFLLGQAMAQGEGELPPNLCTVIVQAMRETLAPLVEQIEGQSAENALLKQQLAQSLERCAQALAREHEQESASERRIKTAWWPFFKRRQ